MQSTQCHGGTKRQPDHDAVAIADAQPDSDKCNWNPRIFSVVVAGARLMSPLGLSQLSRSDLVLWHRSAIPACLQIFPLLEVDR